ncbi:adenylate/guanylate cyclase domain-containing protein [Shimia aestuarii]|uniref:Adenylate cyclase n=1 Tax=Shimia aestuarii TaxID=254406 RepID=A0A1I4TQG3_9RHOB|nr:adenylate/guanylate cyclase domain-containing protein [Shimia aestuarii]SFM78926.1 adenylate cyclase [Shimia aestuarii]
MHRNPRLSALNSWLVAGAPGADGFSEINAEIGRRLKAANLPVDFFGIYKTLMHPELPGRFDFWTEVAGPKTVRLTPRQLRESDQWIGTPGQVCSNTGRMLLYSFGDNPDFDGRPDMKALQKRGYVQSLCLPLHSRYTPDLNVAIAMTKANGGFDEDQIEVFRGLQAPIARVTEGFVLHESTVAVLSTYVGRDAGSRVLTGNIRRGDTENIPSIVLFIDLESFTQFSNTAAPEDTIGYLNRFFSVLDESVCRNGGEILKFIGDGAMAIFPTPDDQSAQIAAIDGALATLEETRMSMVDKTIGETTLNFRAALNVGDVHYGNIGSVNRMDFTVVGPTVNLTARLLEVGASLGKRMVCSYEVYRLIDADLEDLGEHSFKGFEKPVRVFSLEDYG